MALFLSTYTNKLDKKGRVSVPALFRAALVHPDFNGVVVFRSPQHAALEAMDMGRMAMISATLDNFDLFSETRDDITAALFADACPLTFDAEGRILLPQALLAHAQITDQVTFAGRGPTFQIWNPEAFLAYQEQARARLKTVMPALKLTQLSEGGR
jgi:MraZ protein